MEVERYNRTEAASHLLAMGLTTLAGYALVALGSTWLARIGIAPRHLVAGGYGLQLLMLALIVTRALPYTYVVWALYGLTATVNILGYLLLNEGFSKELAGRASTALNLVMFSTTFAVQWGIGAMADAVRRAFSWDLVRGLQGAFARVVVGEAPGVVLASDSTEALVQHANVLDRLRRWPEALPLLKRARALAPDSEEIWFALRGHLLLFNHHDEAFEDFRAFEPRAKLSARIVAAGLFSARIAPGAEYENKYLPLALDWPYQRGEGGFAGVAVAQAQYFDVSRSALKQLHDTYNRLRQEERAGIADFAATPAGKAGVLHVGYLSADFRDHVMGRLMLDIIARHDPARVSVCAYSLGARELEDAVTGEFRRRCERF